MMYRRFHGLVFLFSLTAIFLLPSLASAIEVALDQIKDPSQKAEAQYYMEVDEERVPPGYEYISLSDEHSVDSSLQSFSRNGASVNLRVSSSADIQKREGVAEIRLGAHGDFSASPKVVYDDEGNIIEFRGTNYAAGAYAGIEATLVTKPSASAAEHPFWGEEADGMPIVITSKYCNTVDIDSSYNFESGSYHSEYQYGKDKFEAAYGPQFNGVGENSHVSYERLPEAYGDTPEQRSYFSIDRTGLTSFGWTEEIHNVQEPRIRSSFSQIGNEHDFIAETDFRVNNWSPSQPSELHIDTTVSYSLEAETIDPVNVKIELIPGVPRITQAMNPVDPNKPLICRHASQAMIGKYWAEKELRQESQPVILNSDIELMQKFLEYELDSDLWSSSARNLNSFLTHMLMTILLIKIKG